MNIHPPPLNALAPALLNTVFGAFYFFPQQHKVFVHPGMSSDVTVVNAFISVIDAMVADTAMMAVTNGIVVCSYNCYIKRLTLKFQVSIVSSPPTICKLSAKLK